MQDIASIKKNLPRDRLRELGVMAVYLFGSEAQGIAGSSSDIDLAILREIPGSFEKNRSDIYSALYEMFTDIFDASNFKTFDIVFLDQASLELQFDVISHGLVLFDADPEARMAYEERTAALYRDFKPILEANNEAVLAQVGS